MEKDFGSNPVHEQIDAAKELRNQNLNRVAEKLETLAESMLRKTVDFLERSSLPLDVSVARILNEMKNNGPTTPFVTFYESFETGEVIGAIVAFAFQVGEKGYGLVSHAFSSVPETDPFLSNELLEHLILITDTLSGSGKTYRGTFVEVYKDKNGVPNLSEAQLKNLGAELLNLGGYTPPSKLETSGSHELYIVESAQPDEYTTAHDLKAFLQIQIARSERDTESDPALARMMRRVDYMIKNNIPIRRNFQTANEQLKLELSERGNVGLFLPKAKPLAKPPC
jgi:hypothetical protein